MDVRFKKASAAVLKLKTQPSVETQQKLYGLFKQATIGDVNVNKPSMFNLKAKKKWEGWNSFKGTTKLKAMEMYIKEATRLVKNEMNKK